MDARLLKAPSMSCGTALESPPETSRMSSSRLPNVNRLRWLARKDARELAVSRAALLVAIAVGPLVGHAFMTAVDTYAEVSGSAGGPAALAQGLSPLDGVIVPTLGAYALISALLLPFVA